MSSYYLKTAKGLFDETYSITEDVISVEKVKTCPVSILWKLHLHVKPTVFDDQAHVWPSGIHSGGGEESQIPPEKRREPAGWTRAGCGAGQ